MAENTSIEWADSTWNPWMGCTKVSPACDNCYASVSTPARTLSIQWGAGQPRKRTSDANWKLPLRWNSRPFYACRVCSWRGDKPAEDKDFKDFPPACPKCASSVETARRRVFCASLADVFDNEVDPKWRADLFALIGQTPNLDWLLLTKRIGNVRAMVNEAARTTLCLNRPYSTALPSNVWLGATICNQAEADRDIPKLLATPAAVRFLSIEPMLGPISLGTIWNDGLHEGQPYLHPLVGAVSDGHGDTGSVPRIDWVICGGESGPNARPMSAQWAQSLRDQCAAAGVAFLMKQWGEWLPMLGQVEGVAVGKKTTVDGWVMGWAGKKAAGRLLDGRTHDEFPA